MLTFNELKIGDVFIDLLQNSPVLRVKFNEFFSKSGTGTYGQQADDEVVKIDWMPNQEYIDQIRLEATAASKPIDIKWCPITKHFLIPGIEDAYIASVLGQSPVSIDTEPKTLGKYYVRIGKHFLFHDLTLQLMCTGYLSHGWYASIEDAVSTLSRYIRVNV